MSPDQTAASFDTIIQADRLKRRNEELAHKILGRNRKVAVLGSGISKRAQDATPRSLAYRISSPKLASQRLASANSGPRNNSQQPPSSLRSRGSTLKPARSRRSDNNRLAAALNSAEGQAVIRDNVTEMSIRGSSSGPVTVIGSNFAPGTTAADIQSAVEQISGQTLSCLIVSQRPTVTAELVFAERPSAENAIANFHNQRADGRTLSMCLKPTIASSHSDHDAFNPPTAPRAWSQHQHTQPFKASREQADRQRRLHRRADPAIQDGSYGFSEQDNRPLGKDERSNNHRFNNRERNRRSNAYEDRKSGRREVQSSGLYSDEMMVDASQISRGRGRRQ